MKVCVYVTVEILTTVESFLFLGVMFVDYQNFAGSKGRNFMGNWFVALQDAALLWYTFVGM